MNPLLILGLLALLAFGVGGKLFSGGNGETPANGSPINGRYRSKSRYTDEINAAFLETDTPPQIIEAVLWVESSDGADISPPDNKNSGEIGVMQIIPKTVALIQAEYPRLANMNPSVPADSIMLGAQYLRIGFDQHKDWDKAIIGYNAGHDSKRVTVSNYLEDWYLKRVTDARISLIQVGG
jgi:soluble lytic murein transglycosylase-like protein